MKRNLSSQKLAMIIHPLCLEDVKYHLPFTRFLNEFAIKGIIKRLPPYKFLHIKRFQTSQDKIVELLIIVCPLLPSQYISDPPNAICKVINAVKLAQTMGAKIAVLGGFNSIVGNQGEEVAKNVRIAVTSGNTFTAALCIEGLIRAMEKNNRDIGCSVVSIIGASGDIGLACSRYFSKYVKKLILCARDLKKLQNLSQEIEPTSKSEIEINTDIEMAVKHSDAILTATSSLAALIKEGMNLKQGAILCDVSMPQNIIKRITLKRGDIFLFKGGRAKIPCYALIKNKKFKNLFPSNSIYGCLAEGLTLILENKYENFSLGRGNITENKMQQIISLAKKHDIELADLNCSNEVH